MRRWWRVRRNIFLCFFFRMRLRRFLISEPIRVARLSVVATLATRGYGDGARPSGTAIYFLLRAGERSHWHRVDAAEIWHFYAGDPLRLW